MWSAWADTLTIHMFCSTDLAARIERAERRLVASAVARVRQRVPDTFTADIAGGFVACTEPGSPLNKAVGLGFAPFDAAAWAAVEAEHTRREAPLQVELSTLADPALAHELTGRGFRLVNFENVSGRPLGPGERPAMPPGLVVDVCPAHAIERWLDVIVTGFCTPDTQGVASHEAYDRALIAGIVRDFASADGVTLFLATRAGELAGAASMRLDDGVAQLLNLGWPLRDRVSRAGHDLLSVKVREVAKIFSARLVEIGIVSPGRL